MNLGEAVDEDKKIDFAPRHAGLRAALEDLRLPAAFAAALEAMASVAARDNPSGECLRDAFDAFDGFEREAAAIDRGSLVGSIVSVVNGEGDEAQKTGVPTALALGSLDNVVMSFAAKVLFWLKGIVATAALPSSRRPSDVNLHPMTLGGTARRKLADELKKKIAVEMGGEGG